MIVPRFCRLVFVIFYAFSPLLNTYDLNTKGPRREAVLNQLGPLGSTLDLNMAQTWPPEKTGKGSSVARNWVYSSRLTFSGTEVNRLTDGQLWKIGMDAYNEMPADLVYYGIIMKQKPNAMTVLAFSNELILVSSQKGKSSFAYDYPKSKVVKSLRLCETIWRDTMGVENVQHGKGGGCGEVMATHLYYTQNTIPLEERNARMATVVNGDHRPPCLSANNEDPWGCNLFVQAEGFTYLDAAIKPEDYDLEAVTGRAPAIDQIPLCYAGGINDV